MITLIQVNQESVSIINFIAKLCMREYLTKDLNLYIYIYFGILHCETY